MEIFDFVRMLAPEVAAKAAGVPPATIHTLERELGIRFPDSYRSFLVGMGYDTGGFARPSLGRRSGDHDERSG